MTYRIDTPATLFDMAELSGANTLVGWAVAREMWSGGETFAMRYCDELVGLLACTQQKPALKRGSTSRKTPPLI